jgi:hypothetical protein
MIYRYSLFTLVLLVFTSIAYSQDTTNHIHEEHDHHRHEIGMASSAVYLVKEEVFGLSFHLHYTYSFPETRFGIGVGYEVIFTEHQHNNIGIAAIYRPVEGLNLNLTPGIAWESGSNHGPVFALHFETSYEFQLHHWHLGPTVSFGYDPEDYHFGLGVHVGYGF